MTPRLSGSRYQCIWCGRHYGGPAAYGLHFHPDTAECLTPDAMQDIGMTLNAAGFWTIDRAARSDDAMSTDRGSCATGTRSLGAA
jgi:hypothetical protein